MEKRATTESTALPSDILPQVFFWNENFETGFEEIDHQHRGLVELVNRLPALSRGVPGAPALAEVLSELRAYAALHFSTEEALWESLPYEDPLIHYLQLHEKEHRDFTRKVAEMGQSTSPETVGEIVHFLTHWLAGHILEADRRMAFVLKGVKKGLSLREAMAAAEGELDLTETFTRTVLSMYDQMVDQALRLMEEMARRKAAESSLRLFGQVVMSVRDGILLLDPDGTIVDANPAFCRPLLVRREDLVGRSIFSPSPSLLDLAPLSQAFQKAKETGHFSGTILIRREEGEADTLWVSLSPVLGEAGETSHLTAIFSPVGELLKENEVLSAAANQDPLTGIPNRRLFNDRFGRALREAVSGGQRGALILIDLDHFKALNDLWGHPAGDQILQAAARRLREAVRQSDTVARLGGDEFAAILSGLHPEREVATLEAQAAAEKIRLALSRPYEISVPCEGGGEDSFLHSCPPSLGVVLFGGESLDEEKKVFEAGDRALYQAKHAGGNAVMMAEEPELEGKHEA